MSEAEAIEFMYEAFVQENRTLADQAGMPSEDFEAQMAQSADSLRYMFANVYVKMKDAGILA